MAAGLIRDILDREIMKSAHVTLTIVAAMGMAARAQQRQDPCSAFAFSETACKASMQQGGYCSEGAWVGATYHEQYPYYYDVYRTYVSAGGAVTPAQMERCHHFGGGRALVARSGFGATGHGGTSGHE
jgi:hypothetical protein